MKSLICLLLILLPLIAVVEAEYKNVRDTSLEPYMRIANWAIGEYNKNTRSNLVFVRNVSGKRQRNPDDRFILIIEARDGSGKTRNYECNVYAPWEADMILESFRPY